MFITGIDSRLGKTGESFMSNKSKILINQRFMMNKIIERGQNFNLYEGVDLIQNRFVNVYVKPMTQQKFFPKQVKEDLKIKLSTPTIWTGTHKIQKLTYMVQVHQKNGPSLKSMFSHINKQISKKDFTNIFYQMIKLVQKIGRAGFVHRQLSLSSIVFDPSPQKNQLYLLNTFGLKKKNQQCPKQATKYCSKGTHLGLNANIKDDLESICYILLDLYSNGNFLRTQSRLEYQSAKSALQPNSICQNLPDVFLEFYYHVMGMNYTDEINYFHWKNLVLKTVSKEWISRPYSWMLSQKDKRKNSEDNEQLDQDTAKTEQTSFILHEQDQNIQQKVFKFILESKVNSMKSKLRKDV